MVKALLERAGRRVLIILSGGRHAFLESFGYPPEKTQKLEFHIRPVETRTTNISGGDNPRLVIHVAHVTWNASVEMSCLLVIQIDIQAVWFLFQQ